MQIDWFTFTIQIINFLVLIALLKHFLYDRIIGTMDQREILIRSRLEEAAQHQQDANREIATYHQKSKALDTQRAAMLVQAKTEVEAERRKLMEVARTEVDEMRTGWYETVRREKRLFLQDLRQRTVQQVCTMARRALTDLANASLEQQVITVFIKRIQSLDGTERTAVIESVQSSKSAIVVRSAFEICPEMRQQICKVVREQIVGNLGVSFETTPSLICGIELQMAGHKIAWSIVDYLETLEASLAEALKVEAEKKG